MYGDCLTESGRLVTYCLCLYVASETQVTQGSFRTIVGQPGYERRLRLLPTKVLGHDDGFSIHEQEVIASPPSRPPEACLLIVKWV